MNELISIRENKGNKLFQHVNYTYRLVTIVVIIQGG